jgi:hypothetical protein
MLILRTCQFLEHYAEALIADIKRGAIAEWLLLPSNLRLTLEQRCHLNPQRADELTAIFSQYGCLTPKVAWPKLSDVTTARGGTSNFYLKSFPEYFGEIPLFGEVYGTVEVTFSVCYDFNQDGGILALECGVCPFG